MRMPALTASAPGSHEGPRPGRRLALGSLLAIPAALVWYVAMTFVGIGLQHALGLADDESLREGGAWGVVGGIGLIVALAVPQVVGVVLGVRARRLGERRLATAGIVLNAAIGAYLVLVSLLGLLLA